MKLPFKLRAGKREVLLLALVTMLVLAPLAVLVRLRSEDGGKVTSTPWTVGPNSSEIPRFEMSPSGRFVAGDVPAPPGSTPTPIMMGAMPNNMSSGGARDLVVFRSSDAREVSRLPVGGDVGQLSWTSDDRFLCASYGPRIWNWRLPRNPPVLLPIGGYSLADPRGDVRLEFNNSLSATRISTLMNVPLALTSLEKIGAALPSGHSTMNGLPEGVRLELRPGTPGGTVEVAVVVADPTPTPTPFPTMAPLPTPKPTPKPLPAQKERDAERDRLVEQMRAVVERLQSEEPLSPAQIEKLRQQGRAIIEASRRLNARPVPTAVPDERAPFPTATPSPPFRARLATLSLWDLSAGQRLWSRRVPALGDGTNFALFSPDGAWLALVGTQRPSPSGLGGAASSGVDVFDASTGAPGARITRESDFGWIDGHDFRFLAGDAFVLKDRNVANEATLRFFDAKSGQQTAKWNLARLQARMPDLDTSAWSCDAHGVMWAFAARGRPFQSLSAAQVEEVALEDEPFASPTPTRVR
jgi:hypothetical protein